MKPIYYAGIGSRETPQEILNYFTVLGRYFAQLEFVLRSGGAQGADKAFENGSDLIEGCKEIYLPWKGFEGSKSPYYQDRPEAREIAATYHPAWERLSEGAKKLQTRNVHQILGWELDTPSNFVICWTKKGKGTGGTGQAIRIANAYNIPVFDFGKYKELDTAKQELKKLLLELRLIEL